MSKALIATSTDPCLSTCPKCGGPTYALKIGGLTLFHCDKCNPNWPAPWATSIEADLVPPEPEGCDCGNPRCEYPGSLNCRRPI